MADKIYLNARFGYREDTLENWQLFNPVLERGEIAIIRNGTDGNFLKIGDGVTAFTLLPFAHLPKGEKGETGKIGPKGDKGDKGDRGERGADGKDATAKQYELIEKITTTEELVSIMRTVEPDGTPYSFSKIQCYFSVPKTAATAWGGIKIDEYVAASFNGILNSSWDAQSEVEVICDVGLNQTVYNYAQHTNYMGNPANLQRALANLPLSKKIEKVTFNASETIPWPAGTQIRIYGVRA